MNVYSINGGTNDYREEWLTQLHIMDELKRCRDRGRLFKRWLWSRNRLQDNPYRAL